MARTVVGVAANLCPVDAEGKIIHSSVSCRFAEIIVDSQRSFVKSVVSL